MLQAMTLRRQPYIAALLAFAWFIGIRVISMAPLTGDEPHYLVLAQSLLSDQDLKVANNYNRGDYRAYYAGELDPHTIGGDDPALGRYSIHPPGLAAIVAPAFFPAGPWGAIVLLAALVAAGTGFVWSAGYSLTHSVAAAWFAWTVLTMTAPVALFGSLIYPDAVAGAIVAAGVWTVIRNRPIDDVHAVLLGVAVGALPWLHPRLAIATAGLVFVVALRTWNHRRQTVLFLTATVVMVSGWLVHFQVAYGSFDPRAAYGGRVPVDAAHVINGLTALLADQEFGLLPNAPVHLVVASGLLLLARLQRRVCAELALIVVPYTVATCGYSMWWAGYCPPARFLVPALFTVAPAAALAWSATSRPSRIVALALLAVSVAIASFMAFPQHGALAYNDADGSARWMDWVSGGGWLSSVLPSFFRGHAAGTSATEMRWSLLKPALLWSVAAAGIVLWLARWKRERLMRSID